MISEDTYFRIIERNLADSYRDEISYEVNGFSYTIFEETYIIDQSFTRLYYSVRDNIKKLNESIYQNADFWRTTRQDQ